MTAPVPAAANSSFYAGMRILPKAEREAMYAVYAFCRAVDDIADDQQGDPTDRRAALDQWRRDIAALYEAGDAGQAEPLRSAVDQFGCKQADFIAVIDGMEMDVDADIRWPPEDVLDLYCDRVASAVGRLSVKIFGMEEAPGEALSHHLGRALQLTNILRDIDEDAAIGRVYLPKEGLEAQGIKLTTPAEVVVQPGIDAVCRPISQRALAHFDEAYKIFRSRPRGHLIAPRLMEVVYADVLRRLIRTGWHAPRKRVGSRKLRALAAFLWLRLTT
jgi:phytoene synthase